MHRHIPLPLSFTPRETCTPRPNHTVRTELSPLPSSPRPAFTRQHRGQGGALSYPEPLVPAVPSFPRPEPGLPNSSTRERLVKPFRSQFKPHNLIQSLPWHPVPQRSAPGLPWWASDLDFMLPVQGAQVHSCLGTRSCVPQLRPGTAK